MLIIWDIAGQSKFSTFRKQFYSGTHGVIFVCDVTDPASFQDIKKWYADVNPTVKTVKGIIIGNKTDLDTSRQVSMQELEELSAELGMAAFQTSALSGENVDVAFEELARKLFNER
jgi:small GTP-binding protein